MTQPLGPRDAAISGEPAEAPALLVDAEGVDLTLIRWMLSLSPSDRLNVLVDQVQTIEQLRIRASAE